MSIKYNYNNKRVTFDMQDRIEEKIDRLVAMMSKLTAKDDGTNKQFKPKISQSKRRQTRNFYDKHNYNQKIIRIGKDQVVEIGEFHLVVEFGVDNIIEVDQGINRAIGMTLEEETLEVT